MPLRDSRPAGMEKRELCSCRYNGGQGYTRRHGFSPLTQGA